MSPWVVTKVDELKMSWRDLWLAEKREVGRTKATKQTSDRD